MEIILIDNRQAEPSDQILRIKEAIMQARGTFIYPEQQDESKQKKQNQN